MIEKRIHYAFAVLKELLFGQARGVVERASACSIVNDSNQLAQLANILRYIESDSISGGARAVLVCAAPKSASTFLVQALSEAFGLSIANYSHIQVDSRGSETLLDQELSFSSILFRKFVVGDSVSQLHVTASKRNLEIIRNLKVKCIVTQRNLFDTAVSLRDNFVNTTTNESVLKQDNQYAPGHGVFFRMPPFNARREARLGSDVEQYDFVIDHLMPWYFQFYGTWLWAERQGSIPLIRVSYDELTADPKAVLERLSGFVGCNTKLDLVEQRIAEIKSNKQRSNYNVGRTGRGRQLLTTAQQKRLVETGCRYMNYDDFKHLL